MRGSHDLGGLEGLGPISPEAESCEPVFHADWEKRIFALTLAVGFLGQWNLDESRHARERQSPDDYLRHSYYENWWVGLKTLLLEKGLVSEEEFDSGEPRFQASSLGLSALRVEDSAGILLKGSSVEMQTEKAPGFRVGDQVRVRQEITTGHTRIPSYVRGRVGIIECHHGAPCLRTAMLWGIARQSTSTAYGSHLARSGARSLRRMPVLVSGSICGSRTWKRREE